MRRPLRLAGFNVKGFHEKKEAYADAFEEYFATARTKLGGHVQDLDFGTRIELWNDVEAKKLSYFVEGAQEIHVDLVRSAVPGATA